VSDLYRDPATGDIALSGTKQIRLTTADEEVLQRLKSRLSRWSGEWFHDNTLGVPYRRDVLIKNPDLEVIRSLLSAEIAKDPAVATVVSVTVAFDSVARNLTASFEVRATETGVLLGGDAAIYSLASDLGAVITLDDDTPIVE